MENRFCARLFDELEALYPDSDVLNGKTDYAVAGANGTTAGVHIFMSGLTPGMPLSIEVTGPHTAFRMSQLIAVPVEVNTGARQRSAYLHNDVNKTVIRKAPFYVYDALKPIYNLIMPDGVSAALAFKTPVEYAREVKTENWTIRVTHMGKTEALTLAVTHYPCFVPRANKDTHRYVNWISYSAVARMHNLQMDSKAYFAMLHRYLSAAVYCRQNIMPLDTTGFFSVKKGVVILDEERLTKYVEAGQKAGFERFEGMAFASRMSGQADSDEFYNSLPHDTYTHPDQVAQAFREVAFDKFDNGTRAKISLTGDDAQSPEGERILRAEARLLYAYIVRHHLENVWEQCCMDEPNDALAEAYRHISRIVHEEMPGIPVIEPVLPTRALTGSVDIWCPTNETYELNRDYFDARVAAGDKLYVYTCLTPGGNYMNRMLDMQRLRQTYLGWVPAIYDNVCGYLHWGYNQYPVDVNPFERSACMFSEKELEFHPKRAMFLPTGDYCIVYPGSIGPMLTTRSEAQRMGLEDLCLLETLSSETRKAIAAKLVRGYADWTNDIARYREVKKELLEACAK